MVHTGFSLASGVPMSRSVSMSDAGSRWRAQWAKAVFLAAAALVLWLLLAAVLKSQGCEALERRAPWLELANGATWPEHWPELCSRDSGSFMLALSARTLLNFGGPLLVVLSAIWFLTGGLERFVAMTHEQQMRLLSTQLVAELYTVVRSRRGDASDEQMRAEVNEMQHVASEVVTGFLHTVTQPRKDRPRSAMGS